MTSTQIIESPQKIHKLYNIVDQKSNAKMFTTCLTNLQQIKYLVEFELLFN